ncbi:MAG: hypothetical protein AAB426_05590 [Myxococcota bacterium]
MFCPACRSEFISTVSRCRNCDVALVAALAPMDDFATPEGMATLLADKELAAVMTGVHVELHRVQRLLASDRVASVIGAESDEANVEPGMHARFRLLVAAEDTERAAAVFRRLWEERVGAEGLDGATPSTVSIESCPACGTSVPAAAPECPECGLFLGEAADVG